jgi:hypothetical protein
MRGTPVCERGIGERNSLRVRGIVRTTEANLGSYQGNWAKDDKGSCFGHVAGPTGAVWHGRHRWAAERRREKWADTKLEVKGGWTEPELKVCCLRSGFRKWQAPTLIAPSWNRGLSRHDDEKAKYSILESMRIQSCCCERDGGQRSDIGEIKDRGTVRPNGHLRSRRTASNGDEKTWLNSRSGHSWTTQPDE